MLTEPSQTNFKVSQNELSLGFAALNLIGVMLKMSPCITPTQFIDIVLKFASSFSQKMVSSSSSSEAVEAVLGIVAKGNAILAEISKLAEVLVLARLAEICPHYIYCFMKLCL